MLKEDQKLNYNNSMIYYQLQTLIDAGLVEYFTNERMWV
jgi:predicted transcriptional regulator